MSTAEELVGTEPADLLGQLPPTLIRLLAQLVGLSREAVAVELYGLGRDDRDLLRKLGCIEFENLMGYIMVTSRLMTAIDAAQTLMCYLQEKGEYNIKRFFAGD